jgi:isoamylase
MRHPHVLQLIMDSLRYWVTEMHVDGFRFDLASTLARELHDVDRLSAFFDLIQQDPVISQVKLIAEPWDVGEGGYQVGNFPPLWSEWNGKYRDTVRDYWRGEPTHPAASSPPPHRQRRPVRATAAARTPASTSSPPTTASRCATWSPTTTSTTRPTARTTATARRQPLVELRRRGPDRRPRGQRAARPQQRNFLATLLLSQGVPMLLGGDEIGRTQHGNNNAYCQDNEISWFDWGHWLVGRLGHDERAYDTTWLTRAGDEMDDHHWQIGTTRSLQVFLNGMAIKRRGDRGEPVADDSYLLLLNADSEERTFELASGVFGDAWQLVLDTADGLPPSDREVHQAGAELTLTGHHLMLLRRVEAH